MPLCLKLDQSAPGARSPPPKKGSKESGLRVFGPGRYFPYVLHLFSFSFNALRPQFDFAREREWDLCARWCGPLTSDPSAMSHRKEDDDLVSPVSPASVVFPM